MTYVIGILLTAFMVWYAFYTRLSAKFVIIEVLSYIVGLLVGLGCCYEFGWNPGIGIIVAAVVSMLPANIVTHSAKATALIAFLYISFPSPF